MPRTRPHVLDEPVVREGLEGERPLDDVLLFSLLRAPYRWHGTPVATRASIEDCAIRPYARMCWPCSGCAVTTSARRIGGTRIVRGAETSG